jgi:MFS family permease
VTFFGKEQPLVRALLVAGTVANFLLSGYSAVAVVFLTVKAGAAAIGALLAVGAVGATVGVLSAAPLARRFGDARLMVVSPVVQAACGLLIPLAAPGPRTVLFAIGVFGVTAGIGVFAVCARAAIQQTVPAHLLSRTMSAIQLFGRGATPVGALCGGALATFTSPRTALTLLLAGLTAPAMLLFFTPVRQVRTLTELSVPTSAKVSQVAHVE